MQLYLSALDDQVRLPDENPSIGIVKCKSKNRTYVEYALRNSSAPIGVSTYSLSRSLPKELRGLLPSPEIIAERLEAFGDGEPFGDGDA